MHRIRLLDSFKTQDCVCCAVAKYKRTLCVKKVITTGKTVTIHADIRGSMQTTSCGGGRYFLAMTTGEERYIRVHILKIGDSTEWYFDSYVTKIERHTNKKGRRIHTDNEPELLQMRPEPERSGTILTTSSAYTPSANRLAESFNRALLDRARFMIEHSRLDLTFWAEAIWHMADLHNRMMTVGKDLGPNEGASLDDFG